MNAHSIPPVPPSPYNGYLPVAFPVGGASPTPVIGSAVTGVGGVGGESWRLWGRRRSIGFLTERKTEEVQRGVQQ